MMLLAFVAAAVAVSPAEPKLRLDESRRVMGDYADCIVRKNRKVAAEAVLQQANPRELLKQPRLVDGTCMPRHTGGRLKLEMKGPLLLYALADALVDSDRSLDLSGLDAVSGLDHRPVDEAWFAEQARKRTKADELAELAADQAKAAADVAVSRFGECVVRRAPTDTLALLRTRQGSAEERAAFVSVVPALGRCLPAGQKVEFGKDVLRGALALNLYRLANAPRSAAATGGSGQ